jgi:hypothetical protein
MPSLSYSPEEIAGTLPIAVTGGLREATWIVRTAFPTASQAFVDSVAGALLARTRRGHSHTSSEHTEAA